MATYREPIQAETVAAYLDELQEYIDEEVEYAIMYWIKEKPKFPSISDLRRACQERQQGAAAWAPSDHMLTDSQDAPQRRTWMRPADTPASRMRQLNRYPILQKRYKEN